MTEARTEVLSIRVTKAQKRRLQRIARKKKETVSTLLLRAAEAAEDLPPRETGGGTEEIRIEIGESIGAESTRPEIHRDESKRITLSDEARRMGE